MSVKHTFLSRCLRAAGISQKSLGEAVGITQPAVQSWCVRRAAPTAENAKRAVAFFDSFRRKHRYAGRLPTFEELLLPPE